MTDTNTNLQQRCYNFANAIQQIPSSSIGAAVGTGVVIDRAGSRSEYITDYIKNNSLKTDKFTRKTIEKELVKTKKLSPKLKTFAGAFILPFVGVTVLFEVFKNNLFKF